MRYTLRHKEGTETFQRIMNGRKWIGRVAAHTDGKHYVGRIGNLSVLETTPIAAFEEVTAKAMGFKSAADLRRQNAETRVHNRAVKRRGRQMMEEMLGPEIVSLLNRLARR